MIARFSLLSFVFFLFIYSLALVIPSPQGQAEIKKDYSNHYTIVATTTQVADLVQNIAGAKATVTSLLGPETDPHLYKLTRTDTSKLVNADVVFYSGLMLEGRMESVITKLKETHKPIYAIADLIDETYFIPDEEGINPLNPYDPHIWNNIKLWDNAAGRVADTLCKIDKSGCVFYQGNAARYQADLQALDQYVHHVFNSIPKNQRVLVTAHDAFNYLGAAYDIEVLGIQGISTDSEAGLFHINKLVDLIINRNIKAIFVETSVSDRNVKALIEGAASRGHVLKIGGYLYSDAMGKAGTDEGTYIGMMDHNITTITKALGGRAPSKGFRSSPFYANNHKQNTDL